MKLYEAGPSLIRATALLQLPAVVCPEQKPWFRRCSVGVRRREVGMSDSRWAVEQLRRGSLRFTSGNQVTAQDDRALGGGNAWSARARSRLGLGTGERCTGGMAWAIGHVSVAAVRPSVGRGQSQRLGSESRRPGW